MKNANEEPRSTAVIGDQRQGTRASRRIGRLVLVGAASVLAAACGPSTPPVTDDGWEILFDGTTLNYFDVSGDANWRIEDGAVVADEASQTSFLISQPRYADFELELEFWVNTEANSGVFLRCQEQAEISDTTCYEVNIFDTRPDQTYRTGGIVNLAEPAEFVYTGGQWNRYRIRLEGDRIQVELNGRDMVDVRDDEFASGPIALQYGTGVVRFRNVRVRPL